MRVHIPSPLKSYTAQRTEVAAAGASVAELIDDLERQFPGIKFRFIDEQGAIRLHMRIFVNGVEIATLRTPLQPQDEIRILQALSGG